MMLIVAVILFNTYFFSATAQSPTVNSRVSVTTMENKTNIWVSDFPIMTSVVITDNENNLLSVISTNNFGAAFISLPVKIKTVIIVKTLHGEIMVSNKAVIKNKPEENVAANTNADLNKA